MMKIAPRDIFNDANFYKNLSYLLNYIAHESLTGLTFTCDADRVLSGDFLTINEDDGNLYAPYEAFYQTSTQDAWMLTRPMNSRDAFPVYLVDDNYEEIPVFTEQGLPSPEALEHFNESTPGDINNNDPAVIMGYSLALKGIAKLALKAIDGVSCTANVTFDEALYSDTGLNFSCEEDYFYLDAPGMITLKEHTIAFRSPVTTTQDNLWPLEYGTDQGTFHPVYTREGEFTDAFLALASQPEREITPGHDRQQESVPSRSPSR